MSNEWIKDALNIRYVKLHFEIKFLEDTIMPKNKTSALRGGMGEMLLQANCIMDRDCEHCDFDNECIVRRIMYSQFKIKPKFVTTGESIGYVLECEDFREKFACGDILKFNIIIFGKTIVYLNQIMQALFMLGQSGLGKNHSRFLIIRVTNTKRETLMEDGQIYKSRYEVGTVFEYVENRMKNDEISNMMLWNAPATIKYDGKLIERFSSEAIFAAIERRIYMLDCFEGIDIKRKEPLKNIPQIKNQNSNTISVRRYSSTHNGGIYLTGLKGIVEFDNIDEYIYMLLLAGELIHIGKNTSFGFGRYTMIK
ncbi:MAG: CRISPR system precrRNA processing endoribonuclease RAMP protein Cas6 [Lachnospiraceae bacterium]|nr:CRISPR system precrRNA processing endoribonuclease RAMP protein Cas6 [Lachnospiraceae bacterium]